MEMISPEGEHVNFQKPILPEGGLVENWLNALEAEMFASMRLEQMKSVREIGRASCRERV